MPNEVPLNVIPDPAAPEMIPLKMRDPLVRELVMVLEDAPRSAFPENVPVKVPAKLKFPPTVMGFEKVRVAVVLIVPPFNVNVPAPNAPVTVGLTIPELRVNPPENVLAPESVSEPAPTPLSDKILLVPVIILDIEILPTLSRKILLFTVFAKTMFIF